MSEVTRLNSEQQRAVDHNDGPMLVVAGAGTGKTQVITRRIARLIEDGLAQPNQILALTFTEKAAREMSDRLYKLLGWRGSGCNVLTFNAFGAELLGRYGSHIGRSTRGGLLNDTQKALLLRQHIDEITLDYYSLQANNFEFIRRMVDYIGRLQTARITAAAYREFVGSLRPHTGGWHPADITEQHDLVSFYELYERAKATSGSYDYDDQLALPLEILRQRPNLAERLQREYRYVLVDEYQDTSPIQDALLRQLVKPGGNLFAVGDDDQAIYSFRGADLNNILDFTQYFGVTEPIVLTQNYRSGQPILDAAYRLITHNNPTRLEARLGLTKQLLAQTPAAVVEFRSAATTGDETTAVMKSIEAKVAAGDKLAEVAVLARSNAVLRSYAKALRSRSIPYAMSTAINIFEQREVINLWYLLEWIAGRATDESIAHVVMGPFVGWSAATWRKVVASARVSLTTVEEALRDLADQDEAAAELVTRLDTWREWSLSDSVGRLAYRLVFEGDVARNLMAEADDQPVRVARVFEDLHRLFEQMQDYESVTLDANLVNYLAWFPEPPMLEVAETLGDNDGVQLLTIHASKGLEFEAVYLVGCTAKAWSPSAPTGLVIPPQLHATDELPPEHEERRLLYVAATRAKRELYLSAAAASAGGAKQRLSPLIEELIGETPVLVIPESSTNVESSLQKLQRFYPLKSELPDRLPFETADGWIELGVNDLARFADAPHDFYLQNVLKITQPFGPQLAFGSVLHKVFEAHYKARLNGTLLSSDELATQLDAAWRNDGYETRGLAEAALARAHDTLRRFLAREASIDREVLASEYAIRYELTECKLRLSGRIDAMFTTSEGLEVRDFKTGNLSDTEKIAAKAKDSFQLRAYALAIEQDRGTPPTVVTLDYVVTGSEGSAKLTPLLLKNFRTKLISLAERLRERDFHPGSPSSFNPSAAFRYYGNDDDEVNL